MSSTVVVTGAASGIGAAVAETLRAAGVNVVGVDRSVASSNDAQYVEADLSSHEGVMSAVEGIRAAAPHGLDGLVNVAGVPGTAPLPTVVGVNVLAVRDLTAHLAPDLRRGSAVIHVASNVAAGWTGRAAKIQQVTSTVDWHGAIGLVESDPELVADVYRFSKECVRQITEVQAAGLVSRGVRVVSVSPGPVQTPILEDFKNDHGRAKVESAAEALGRFGEPDDVAGVIAFLLSPAARWINGTDVRVDGGLLAVRAAATEVARVD